MSSTLDDHRRIARWTLLVIAGLIAVLAGLLALLGRASAIPGLLAGGGLAALDVLLLARGLSRFGRASHSVGAGALTGALLSRFVVVGSLMGVLMAARTLAPVAVIAGFLTLPVGLVSVGLASIRRKPGAGGARRRHFAR
ncbi:MAG: hypothetical protein NVSMB29_09710 [Candidatus Dormibacteria bacterium]